ncbi:MAG TPA: chloride channel protein [Verrucomicrobiae bacterium]|nr:chloride channel protein [Verrucomicrobiae bacterium]
MSIGLGLVGGVVAPLLMKLIGFVTNLSFYGRLSSDFSSPAGNHLGAWVIVVPAIGGVIVGIMARFGSRAIRGHGIPEAMEQVLEGNSRIPARITVLKPLSAAVAIGTGGPFGAEGPIIATGGALGSLVGQVLSTTGAERKTLLAAGAAAGMAATFGSPVSAVLLAVELLLFEFRARSLIPVALASAVAAGVRIKLMGAEAIFSMPTVDPVGLNALALYALLGIVIGVVAVVVTRIVYWLEDMFEHLPVHWMWWPAIGGLAVGIVGYFAPRTLGVGYDNIADILSNRFSLHLLAFLCVMKFVSWSIALSSGTSGGTLAPLFTIGSGAGAALGAFFLWIFPASGLDVRVAALVGMAAIFAGASRALLASIIFAFETTHQTNGLLPLLVGSTLAYLIARMLMQNSIMTEKIARRGLRIPEDYDADVFRQTNVQAVMEKDVKALPPDMLVSELADRIAHHDPEISSRDAWPLVGPDKQLAGIITRNDVIRSLEKSGAANLKLSEAGNAALVTAFPDETLHEAVARMLTHGVGRLLVVSRDDPKQIIGYVSRTHLLSSRFRQVQQEQVREDGWLRKRSIK